MKTYPAGITWQRTGGRTWVCTIRLEPETVYDLSDYYSLRNAAGLAHQSAFTGLGRMAASGRCPCCGQSQGLGGFGLGVFGGLFG
jgi:hypothetical protein